MTCDCASLVGASLCIILLFVCYCKLQLGERQRCDTIHLLYSTLILYMLLNIRYSHRSQHIAITAQAPEAPACHSKHRSTVTASLPVHSAGGRACPSNMSNTRPLIHVFKPPFTVTACRWFKRITPGQAADEQRFSIPGSQRRAMPALSTPPSSAVQLGSLAPASACVPQLCLHQLHMPLRAVTSPRQLRTSSRSTLPCHSPPCAEARSPHAR